MRLSTKGRYAVTAMIDLAIHDRIRPVTLAEISKCQGISLSYLEQLFSKLRKARLVEGVRGPGGGYRLGQRPEKISIANVITAVDESLDVTRCKGEKDEQDEDCCLTHEIWDDINDQVYNFLEGITLEQVANRPEVQQLSRRQNARGGARHHLIFDHDAA